MPIAPDKTVPLPEKIKRAHFCGIGGSGMSAIAKLFLDLGIRVSGTDREDSKTLTELTTAGANVKVGHDPAMLDGVDTFIYSGAIDNFNPEYVAAKKLGLNLLHRSLALKWATRDKSLVSIAGSHGKTSTTGMIATALHILGEKCGFVNGGRINFFSGSAHLGEGDLFVIEADESDGSFLFYETDIAVINNISMDHADYYNSPEDLENSFFEFAVRAKKAVAISLDDKPCRNIAKSLLEPGLGRLHTVTSGTDKSNAGGLGAEISRKQIITFGRHKSADIRLCEIKNISPISFIISYDDRLYETTFKNLFGEHHALNTCGALAALLCLGYPPEAALEAISHFNGTKRRLEIHFDSGHKVPAGIKIFDDYAHHPKEIETALLAIRSIPHARLIAVFQPHLYSRTALLHREFAAVLEKFSDYSVILPICAARESPIPGVDAKMVFDKFKNKDNVVLLNGFDAVSSFFSGFLKPGDLVITLGCGDVYKVIPSIIDQVRAIT